jgi:hypothetical protein
LGEKMKQYYGMRVSTLLAAADKLSDDLEYLCSLTEEPHEEFPIVDAVIYSTAVMSLTYQINFILEDLAERDLSADEEYVKLTQEDVVTLTSYSDSSEDALMMLEKICGISLQNN